MHHVFENVYTIQSMLLLFFFKQKFPAAVTIPNDPPDKLKIRQATVITIKAAITDPFFDIKLTVSQPLGYEVSAPKKYSYVYYVITN